MRGFWNRLKRQYNFRHDMGEEYGAVDVSEGMLISISMGGLSLALVGLLMWIFIIRFQSRTPMQSLAWYVSNPLKISLCAFFIASVVYLFMKKTPDISERSIRVCEFIISAMYLFTYCAGFFFLRKFEMSFLLLVMPLVMMVLRGSKNYPVALSILVAVYVITRLMPVYIFGEPREDIPFEANVLFGIWVIVATTYLLALTKNSAVYSYKKKEEEELKQNAFAKQLSKMSHDVRTPIHSIRGMSEMILRNNVSERTGRDIVVIREAAEDILSTLDKTLESSRIELSGVSDRPAPEDTNETADNGADTYLYAPKAHVLAVDDSILNLNVIRALLRRTGISLDCALSGQEALKLVSYNYYDVILLDHMMPDMDGIETIHNIRSNPGANEETPIIVITANDIAGARGMYRREGFADCVRKPISGEELEAVLEKYLPPHLVSRRNI